MQIFLTQRKNPNPIARKGVKKGKAEKFKFYKEL
jgi:hypothetical protein